MVNLGFIQFEWWWVAFFSLLTTIVTGVFSWRISGAKARRELADATYREAEAKQLTVDAENDSWDAKYKAYVDSLQTQNLNMFQRQDAILQENQKLREEITGLKTENATMRVRIEHQEEEISDLKATILRVEMEGDAYKQQILELRELINSLRTAVYNKHNDNATTIPPTPI